jgi:rubrerythrin
MYEAFLKRDLPNDVRDVFEALKSASGKHLEAFERLVRREA